MAEIKKLSELVVGDKVINHYGNGLKRVVTVESVHERGFTAGGKSYMRDGRYRWEFDDMHWYPPIFHDYIIPTSEELIQRIEGESQCQ